MRQYPGSAVERAMKIQEVILRAVSGEIHWFQAADILGIFARQMHRWKKRYEEFGYDGLFHRPAGAAESQARAARHGRTGPAVVSGGHCHVDEDRA
jgi:Helix-turn-helix domain